MQMVQAAKAAFSGASGCAPTAVSIVEEADGPALPVRDITEEVLDYFMGADGWRARRHVHMTFKDEAFALTTLDGLLATNIDLSGLLSLDISNNELEGLKCLDGTSPALPAERQAGLRFQSLQVLKARHNRLSDFSAVLPCLKELDLGYNRLNTTPILVGLPMLEVLVLAHNLINDSFRGFCTSRMLHRLDISNNEFDILPLKLAEELKHFENLPLHTLKLQDNPFILDFPEYEGLVLCSFPRLKKLDRVQDMAAARATWTPSMFSEIWNYHDAALHRRQNRLNMRHSSAGSEEVGELPNFNVDFFAPIEEALMDPRNIPMALQQLSQTVNSLLQLDPSEAHIFWRNKANLDDEVNEEVLHSKIQAWAGNIQILFGRTETQASTQESLFSALANLAASSRSGNLGIHCANLLDGQLISNKDREDMILDIINNIIVQPLTDYEELDPEADVAIRCLTCFESPRISDILMPMASWLTRMYCSTLPPHDGITKLLARALTNKTSLEAALSLSSFGQEVSTKTNLPQHVVSTLEALHVSTNAVSQLKSIPHLQILKATTTQWTGSTTTKATDNVVKVYIARNFHATLLKCCIQSYELEGSISESGSGAKNIDIRRMSVSAFNVAAAALDALTGLMAQSRHIVNAIGDTLLEYILLANVGDIVPDPVLLAASIRGLSVFLRHYKIDKPAERQLFLMRVIKELGSMKPYLELINRDTRRFNDLWRAAQHRALYEHGDNASRADFRQPPRLGHLHDESVIQCLAACVALIEFFTAEVKTNDLCKEVSDTMNSNDREMLLFKLLEVPSSSLTSSVIRCIGEVDFSEVSSVEVQQLIRMIEIATENLPDTTLLLASLIEQLRKFAADPFATGASMFLRVEHASQAVQAVASALLENVRIPAKGTKLAAKTALTKASLAFLHCAGKVGELRDPVMLSPEYAKCIEDILKAEDAGRPGEIDVAIERTWGARCVEALLPCFAAHNRLRVRGKVAFRIITRVADILGGRIDQANSGGDDYEAYEFSVHLSRAEVEMWDETQMKYDLRKLDDIEKEHRSEQQVMFAQANGVTRIFKFLTRIMGDGGALQKLREVTALQEAERFFAESKPAEKQQEQQAIEAPNSDGNHDSSTSAVRPLIEFAGMDFYGASHEAIDLAAPPYKCPRDFGGEISILLTARWDALQNWGTVLDFGSGAPQDNILIANIGRTGNLVFQVNVKSKRLCRKIVVPDCISIGETNTYLFTVTKSGHMRVMCDSHVVGERYDGWLPPNCMREHLYIGRSNWPMAQPFRGRIEHVKVYVGHALTWDDIAADLPEDEDETNETSHVGILGTLLIPQKEQERQVRETVKLRPEVGHVATHKVGMCENFYDDAMLDKVNPAYPMAAALRCIFVMLRMPANGGIRADMAEMLKEPRLVGELVTLTRACGPLNCSVAAKFLRVMSLVLELAPTRSEEDASMVIVYDVLRCLYIELAPLAHTADGSQDPLLSNRGRVLAAEITRILAVICRTVPFCTVSNDRYLQAKFTEECIIRFVPQVVISVISRMILTEPKDSSGVDHEELVLMARGMLTGVMDNCPHIKYGILEVFGAAVAAGSTNTNLLSSLLEQSRQETEGAEFEQFLNTVGTSLSSERTRLVAPGLAQSAGTERVLACVRAMVFLGGQRLPLQNRSHRTPCFCCILTAKAFYIVDLTAPGHPENMKVVQNRDFMDMTRLIKGATGQELHIGWACRDRWSPQLVEEFMTIVCIRSGAQSDLLGKLQRVSAPPPGELMHAVPMQTDLVMEGALEEFDKVGPEFITYVESDYDELKVVMLTDSQLFELDVDFSNWAAPMENEGVIEVEDNSDPASVASGRGVAVEAQESAGGGDSVERGPSAEDINKARSGMRIRTGMVQEGRLCGKVLDCPRGPLPLSALSRMSFYSEGRHRMELIFSDSGYKDVMAFLFDEGAKEELRRLLTSKSEDWEQSYENAGPGGSPTVA